jgi:hypothetical protein
MQGFTVDLGELERCRRVLQAQADKFDEINSQLAGHGDTSSFGRLPASARLAASVNALHTTAKSQLSAAQQFLSDAARGLGDVGHRSGQTDITNAANLEALSPK